MRWLGVSIGCNIGCRMDVQCACGLAIKQDFIFRFFFVLCQENVPFFFEKQIYVFHQSRFTFAVVHSCDILLHSSMYARNRSSWCIFLNGKRHENNHVCLGEIRLHFKFGYGSIVFDLFCFMCASCCFLFQRGFFFLLVCIMHETQSNIRHDKTIHSSVFVFVCRRQMANCLLCFFQCVVLHETKVRSRNWQ